MNECIIKVKEMEQYIYVLFEKKTEKVLEAMLDSK